MRGIYQAYDDYMDALFNTAKLLHDRAGRQDIATQLRDCEQQGKLLHRQIVHHPQHQRLDKEPVRDPLSDTTPPDQPMSRTIRPVEAAEMRRIDEWYAARYQAVQKVRPLAIHRALLPAEEEMGRRRKEPVLDDPQRRVVNWAIQPLGSGSLGTPRDRRPPGGLRIGDRSHFPNLFESLQRPATTTSASESNSMSWAGRLVQPESQTPPPRRMHFLVRGGRGSRVGRGGRGGRQAPSGSRSQGATPQGGDSQGENSQGGDSQGGNSQGGNSWGGNAWGGRPPALEDATDSSEGESSSKEDNKARGDRGSPRSGSTLFRNDGGNGWADMTGRCQTATTKRHRVFDPVGGEVVPATKRHKLGGTGW